MIIIRRLTSITTTIRKASSITLGVGLKKKTSVVTTTLQLLSIRTLVSHTSFIMCKGDSNSLPSSLQGLPVKALVPPGECQFTDTPIAVPVLAKFAVSDTTTLIRFGVPDTTKSLGLSTCACLLATAEINGETIVRPYTPISTNACIGYFDLLVKNYGPTSKMSHFLCDIVQPDETLVSFKHISFNVKTQAPFPYTQIGMIVGGTGITPMIQALHAILGEETPTTKVTMLYGSRTSTDILGKEVLDEWEKKFPDHLKVIHVLSHEPTDSKWTGQRGFINKQMIEQYFPSPTTTEEPFNIFICGPPPMYDVFSGPRTEKQVTGLLGELGYNDEQVYKF